MSQYDVAIVGAGLAGLRVANLLEEQGYHCVLIEQQSKIGGAVQTECVDGYLLDKGFQVLLPAYQQASECFNYEDLNLCYLNRGANLINDDKQFALMHPKYHFFKSLSSLKDSISYIADFYQILRLCKDLKNPLDYACKQPEMSLAAFFEQHFSDAFIKYFLAPFFSGILSDLTLQSSNRLFYFYMACFLKGGSAIPKQGMQALSDQLFYRLKSTCVLLQESVDTLEKNTLCLASGKKIKASHIVFACPHQLLSQYINLPVHYSSLCTYYFALQKPLKPNRSLHLSSCKQSLINHFVCISDVSSSYAKKGSLYSVTSLKSLDVQTNLSAITKELAAYLDVLSHELHFIKAFPIKRVIPLSLQYQSQFLQTTHPFIHVAGDWCIQGSINGALSSAKQCFLHVQKKLENV